MKGAHYMGGAILAVFFLFIALMGYRSWHQTYPLTFLGVILAGFVVIPLLFTLFRIYDRPSGPKE